MGRFIGDDATHFVIQDVLVIPIFKDMGMEIAVFDALLIYIENHVPDGAVIASLASAMNVALFEQPGFRTIIPDALGIFRLIDRTNFNQQRIP